MKQVIDGRGYVGGEKNRELTPEQVVWARRAAFEHRATAGDIRRELAAVGIVMSVESVRRMIRGDTYGNVGAQLPTGAKFGAVPGSQAPELVSVSEEELAASGQRLAALLAQPHVEREAVADPMEIMRRMAAEVEGERARGGDAVLAEMLADPFSERTPASSDPAGDPAGDPGDTSGPNPATSNSSDNATKE